MKGVCFVTCTAYVYLCVYLCVCVRLHTYLCSDVYQMTVVSRLPKQRRVIPKEKSDFKRCPLIPPLPSC